MGKPKNKAKDKDVDSDVDIAESEATEAKPVGKQSKKDKKKKKKDDDWEDDVANELQSLSLEANKGRKEENSVEEERAPVKKKEKEQQKKQALKKDGKVDEPKSEEKTEDQAAAEEKVASGDDEAKEEEDDSKKKKKKGEKEEKPKKCKAPVAAIKELLKRQKEEEERLRQEEEERIRKEEEAIAAAIEKKRLEEEKKKLKKQKEKERKERLKAEGKLLTAQQKQEKLRQQQMLESMKAQGLEIKTKEEEVVEAKKKRPIYEKKKKKPQQKQDDSEPTDKTPSPEDTPAQTPVSEEAPSIVETPEAESSEAVVDTEEKEEVSDIKDELDISSEEEEKEEKESSPEIETKAEAKGKKVEEKVEDEDEESDDDENDDGDESESESESDDDLTPYERAEIKLKELRMEDYTAGRKGKQAGATASFRSFGTPAAAATQPTGFAFGQTKPMAFGVSTGFGANTSTGGSSLYGQPTAQASTGGDLFGQPSAQASTGKGLFGQPSAQTSTGGGLFGQPTAQASTGGGLFGQPTAQESTGGGLFGQPSAQASTGGGLFGQPSAQASTEGGLFGQPSAQASTGGGLFGQPSAQASTGGGLFGQPSAQASTGGGLFGQPSAQASTGGGLFGQPSAQASTGGGLFGQPSAQASTGGGLFGQPSAQASTGGGLFGQPSAQASTGGGLFGQPSAQSSTGGGLFGQPSAQTSTGGGLFGQPTAQASTGEGLFVQPSAQASTVGLLGQLFESYTSTGAGGLIDQAQKDKPSFCTTTTTQPTTGTTTSGQSAATGTAFGGFQTSQTVSTSTANEAGGISDFSAIEDTDEFKGVDSDLIVRLIVDLQILINFLGINWRLLSLMIATDNNRNMFGITEENAKINVIEHFKDAREKLKKNERSPYDITLSDIVGRLKHLLTSDIHWLCVSKSLKKKGHNDLLSNIFSLLPDFDSFWSALSMPHYDGKHDRFQANDPISNELKELKEDINSINVPEDLQDPEKFKEDKKFSFFLEKQNLVSYAKSLNLYQYCSKFQMLSKINIKMGEWERFLNQIGITAIRRKKSVDHFCVMYYLENKYLLGQKITSENRGVGSLGYVFYKDGAMNLMTSSHISLDVAIFNKMKKNQKTFVSLENQCQIEGIENAVIRQGVYSEGDDQSAGVEIVFVDTSSVPYFQSNDFPIPTGHHGPVPVPSLQDAYGTGSICPQSETLVTGTTGSDHPPLDTPVISVTGATGSDCPPFNTSKRGSTVDTDSNTEGTYLDTPVIDGSIFPPIGHLYFQWKRHDLPDHLNFKGNIREDIEIYLEVYILGAVTGLAKGNVTKTDFTFKADYQLVEKLKDKIIRPFQSFFKITKPKPQLLLKKQIVVKWESYEFPFSKKGDSGAPVFQITKDTGELTAVGILTGNNTTLQVSYVTPIKDILHICQANDPNIKLGHFDLRLREQDKDVQKKRFSDLCRKQGID